MKIYLNKKIILTLQLIFSACLLAGVINLLDMNELIEILFVNKLKYYLYIPCVLLHFIGLFILTMRWRQFLDEDHQIKYTTFELYEILLVSRFFGNLLPGQFSSDSYRTYIIYKKTKNLNDSLMSVIFDRFSGMLVIFIISFITIIFYYDLVPSEISLIIFILSGFLIFLTLVIILNIKYKFLERIFYLNNWLRHRFYNLFHFLNLILSDFRRIRRVLILSLIFQFILIFTVFLTFNIYDPSVSLMTIMIVYPLISTFMILPISINGLGQSEAIYIYLYGLFGVNNEVAMTASLTIFSYTIISSLAGGILYVKHKLVDFNQLRQINIIFPKYGRLNEKYKN